MHVICARAVNRRRVTFEVAHRNGHAPVTTETTSFLPCKVIMQTAGSILVWP
jgi:hypothetical protein